MINKVVYSHWSKPMDGEHVGFNSKEAFANCARLSILASKKWASVVELVTDKEGYKFLIEDLKSFKLILFLFLSLPPNSFICKIVSGIP